MSWIHRVLGKDGSSQLAVDPTHFAARMSPRPLEAAGHYRVSVVTGTLAAALAASGQVFQFRHTDASKVAVVKRIRTRFQPLTPFTAATLTDHTSFDAFVCRPFGAGGGGTALTLTGNNAKMRTNQSTSIVSINVSTTAALTAATGMDAHPFAQSIRKGNRVNPAAATEEIVMPQTDGLLFEPNECDGEHPLVLAQNEGFIIRNRTVWPAAGTGILMIEVCWAETTAY